MDYGLRTSACIHVSPGKVLLFSNVEDASESLVCTSCNAWYIISIRPNRNNTRMNNIQFTIPGKRWGKGGKVHQEGQVLSF